MVVTSGRVCLVVATALAVAVSGVSTACGRAADVDVVVPASAPVSVPAPAATGAAPAAEPATPPTTGRVATSPRLPTHPPLPMAASGVAPPASPSAPPTVPGIDVSKWQPEIDWNEVHTGGYEFAYISVVGSAGENPHFNLQWSGAKAAGVYRGAYYFGDPTTGTGEDHADRFLELVGDMRDGRTLPPVLDVERHPRQAACDGVGGDVWVDYISSFIAAVKARTGVTPVIYSAKNFWRECLGDTVAFARNTLLFAAQWNVAAPDVFGGWPRATFWQRTSTGRVPGIDGNTDLDVFFGTPADLRALVVPPL